jgi:hypothetical protein
MSWFVAGIQNQLDFDAVVAEVVEVGTQSLDLDDVVALDSAIARATTIAHVKLCWYVHN